MIQRPTIIITGAAKRLGRATAFYFARRGCNLMIHYNQSAAEAKSLMDDINDDEQSNVEVGIVRAELGQASSLDLIVAAALEQFGRIDHLVNNASIFFPTPMPAIPRNSNNKPATLSSDLLHSFLQLNCIQPINLATAAYPHLKQNSGSVVNLIDIYADAGLKEHTAYVAAKSALKAMTQQQARTFAPSVRVNGVSPGAILWPDQDQSQPQIDNLQRRIIEQTGLKRLGRAENIAETVGYLCLDALYTTGSVINVDGGRRDYV